MNRLKAVLAPATPAAAGARRLTVALAALIAGVAGAGSLAVAAQREPVLIAMPVESPATPEPTVATTVAPASAPAVLSVSATAPTPAAAVAPSPRPAVPATPAPTPSLEPAQEASPMPVITNVTWAQQPMPMYPAEAARDGVNSGTVVLSCNASADGKPSDCSVVSEDPAGAGFGAAALTAMQTARFSPRTLVGAAPGAKVRFTIRFRLGE